MATTQVASVLDTIARVADENLSQIANESGTLLYSSPTTVRPGRFYFLGLNPGGTQDQTATIRQSIDDLRSGLTTENAYLDQDWSSTTKQFGKGGHPLQKNFRYLFESLGEDTSSVCASNLIFSRSVDERGAGGLNRAEICWPVHDAILAVVRPSALITFGRQAFAFIHDKLGGGACGQVCAKHGNWTCQFSDLSGGIKLVGLPHLSRYTLYTRKEVMDKIRDRLQQD